MTEGTVTDVIVSRAHASERLNAMIVWSIVDPVGWASSQRRNTLNVSKPLSLARAKSARVESAS